jgi:hypothetical protein
MAMIFGAIMSTILYGNLRVEILGDLGARLTRLSPRGGALDFVRRSSQSAEVREDGLLGRDELVGEAYAAIRAHRPIEFTAASTRRSPGSPQPAPR